MSLKYITALFERGSFNSHGVYVIHEIDTHCDSNIHDVYIHNDINQDSVFVSKLNDVYLFGQSMLM